MKRKRGSITVLLCIAMIIMGLIVLVSVITSPVSGADVATTEKLELTTPLVDERNDIPITLTFYYDENDIVVLAKILYRECGAVKNVTEQACVAWTVCNWADVGGEDYVGMISKSAKSPNRFAWIAKTPVTDHLYRLASDVLFRWNLEKNGYNVVGRVLPSDYYYFAGDGKHNYFRRNFRNDRDFWDYTLESPYELGAWQ